MAELLPPVPALIRSGQSRRTRLAGVSSYFPMTGGKISWILCECICILRPHVSPSHPSFTKDNNSRQNVPFGETKHGIIVNSIENYTFPYRKTTCQIQTARFSYTGHHTKKWHRERERDCCLTFTDTFILFTQMLQLIKI